MVLKEGSAPPLNSPSIIGKIALQWLVPTKTATIYGITSKGVFLALGDSKIIFIASTKDFGPLNLLLISPLPQQWKIHESIQLSMGQDWITFLHPHEPIIINNYEPWEVPIAPLWNIDLATQNNRLALSTNQIHLLKGEQGFSPILPLLLTPNASLFSHEPAIADIMTHLPALQIEILKPFFAKLIGSGRGLTPSGDDFLVGMLFLLNRFANGFIPDNKLDDLNDAILKLALQKTTALSQSLLYCASQGQADYRIQQLADVLMNETINFEDQALQLARWGNSSGADIFAGMIVAIRTLQSLNRGTHLE